MKITTFLPILTLYCVKLNRDVILFHKPGIFFQQLQIFPVQEIFVNKNAIKMQYNAVFDGGKLTEINRLFTEQTPQINRLTDRAGGANLSRKYYTLF